MISFATRPLSLFTPPEVAAALLSGRGKMAACPQPSIATDNWAFGVLLLELECDEDPLLAPFIREGSTSVLRDHIRSETDARLAERKRQEEHLRICAGAVRNASLRLLLTRLLSQHPEDRLHIPSFRSLVELFGPTHLVSEGIHVQRNICGFLFGCFIYLLLIA